VRSSREHRDVGMSAEALRHFRGHLSGGTASEHVRQHRARPRAPCVNLCREIFARLGGEPAQRDDPLQPQNARIYHVVGHARGDELPALGVRDVNVAVVPAVVRLDLPRRPVDRDQADRLCSGQWTTFRGPYGHTPARTVRRYLLRRWRSRPTPRTSGRDGQCAASGEPIAFPGLTPEVTPAGLIGRRAPPPTPPQLPSTRPKMANRRRPVACPEYPTRADPPDRRCRRCTRPVTGNPKRRSFPQAQ